MEQGFAPATISSDIHVYNLRGPVFDLVTTLSKFLHLGIPLDDVIALATLHPARAIGRLGEFGTLKPGSVADISVLKLQEGPVTFVDAQGDRREGKRRLLPVVTVRAGHRHFAIQA